MTREPDRRASARIPFESRIDLESAHNRGTGITQNIGVGGLFVATHHLPNIGDRLIIGFSLPDEILPIFAEAEVRWIREITSSQRRDGPPGMGLRFVRLSPEASAALESFVPEPRFSYDDGE